MIYAVVYMYIYLQPGGHSHMAINGLISDEYTWCPRIHV